MSTYDEERDVSFEILEEIGIIATQNTGWTKELNLISWNGGVPKYDIREWDPYHMRMSRGITLHEAEMRQVLELMRRRRTYAGRGKKQPTVGHSNQRTTEEAFATTNEVASEAMSEAADETANTAETTVSVEQSTTDEAFDEMQDEQEYEAGLAMQQASETEAPHDSEAGDSF